MSGFDKTGAVTSVQSKTGDVDLIDPTADGKAVMWKEATGELVDATALLSATFVPLLLPRPSGGDDTAALQAAINAAPSGAVCVLSPGAYSSGPLTCGSPITIHADGATVTQKAATSGALITLNGNGSAIFGGTWDGNGETNSIVVLAGADCRLQAATVQNITGEVYGAVYATGTRPRIVGNTIKNVQNRGIFVSAALAAVASPVVADNVIDGSMLAPSTGILTGISVRGSGPANNYLVTGAVVAGNRVYLPTSPTNGCEGIEIDVDNGGTIGCPNTAVLGNYVSGGTFGMGFVGADGSVAQGNVCVGQTSECFEVGSNNVSVTDNVFDGAGLAQECILTDGAVGGYIIADNIVIGYTLYGVFCNNTAGGSKRNCILNNYVLGTTTTAGSAPMVIGNGGQDFDVSGNHFESAVSATNYYGINHEDYQTGDRLRITGNTFVNLALAAVNFTGGVDVVDSCEVGGNLLDPATPNLLHVGGSVTLGTTMIPHAQAVGASPYTYTNATGIRQRVSVLGGTVSAVTKYGVTIASATGATTTLDQGESVTVTYSVAPTVITDRTG